jgi:hypothetical protein
MREAPAGSSDTDHGDSGLDASLERAHTGPMDIEQWWPLISAGTRQWLMAHNGEPVPGDLAGEIARAGGVLSTEAWWLDEIGSDGALVLSDAGVDWIEAAANTE